MKWIGIHVIPGFTDERSKREIGGMGQWVCLSNEEWERVIVDRSQLV